MKISFEDFFDCVAKIIVHHKKLDSYSKVLNYEVIEDMQILSVELERMLVKLCDDENDWIGYWLWELDFGKKYQDGMITDLNERGETINVKLETINDLWNLLVKNYCSKHIKD